MSVTAVTRSGVRTFRWHDAPGVPVLLYHETMPVLCTNGWRKSFGWLRVKRESGGVRKPMRSIRTNVIVLMALMALMALVSCSRDPNSAKKHYLESGDRSEEPRGGK